MLLLLLPVFMCSDVDTLLLWELATLLWESLVSPRNRLLRRFWEAFGASLVAVPPVPAVSIVDFVVTFEMWSPP